MILTVPIQIDLSSPLGWVLAGIVVVLAIWAALGLLQQARRLWRRGQPGGHHDWRRSPDGSGVPRGDLWSGGGENFRRWLGTGFGPRGRVMRSPLLDGLLICSLFGNAFVAYLYRDELIAIGYRLWDRVAFAW